MPGPISPQHRAAAEQRRDARFRRRRDAVALAVLAPVQAWMRLRRPGTGLWYYSASKADQTLAGSGRARSRSGHVYSCVSQINERISARHYARCGDTSAEVKNSEPPYAVAARARFRGQVYDPTRLIGGFAGPLTVASLGRSHEPDDELDPRTDYRRRHTARPDGLFELSTPHVDAVGGGETYSRPSGSIPGPHPAGSPQDHAVIDDDAPPRRRGSTDAPRPAGAARPGDRIRCRRDAASRV